MRKVKRWRYYCDFCKKSLGHAFYMKRHEKNCTNNPDRSCRMCQFAGLATVPVKDLIDSLGNGGAEGLKNLKEKADGCPACMLAAIRQKEGTETIECLNGYEHVYFVFEEEKKAFFDDINEPNPYY